MIVPGAINAYGIKIDHRIYDSEDLNPRLDPSGMVKYYICPIPGPGPPVAGR